MLSFLRLTLFFNNNRYKELPTAVKDEVFASIQGDAKDDENDTKKNAIMMLQKIMDQPTAHLVRILSPAFKIAVAVAQLTKKSEAFNEKTDSAKATNDLLEEGLKHTSKLVANLHRELVALPKPIQDYALQQLPEEARKVAEPVLELTNGMIEKDVEELFITMAREAFPKKAVAREPPQEVTLSVKHNYEQVTSTPESKVSERT